MSENERKVKMLHELQVVRYPLRTCRSLHTCAACGSAITLGQPYYDGGYGRRIHANEDCQAFNPRNPKMPATPTQEGE
jgi:hypothetical protein